MGAGILGSFLKGLHLVSVQTVIEHKAYQLIHLVSQIALFFYSLLFAQILGFSSLTFDSYQENLS